jgi:hypothetical protein
MLALSRVKERGVGKQKSRMYQTIKPFQKGGRVIIQHKNIFLINIINLTGELY